MDQKSVIGLAVTHTQSQIHSPGARTTFSMFRLVIYASKGLFHCESKSIRDGAHLLNFLPPQLTMTFNRHDAVHVQFILSSHIVCLIYGKCFVYKNVFVLNGHLKTIYM